MSLLEFDETFSVFSMGGGGEAYVAFVDKAKAEGEKGEKREEEEKESDSKVGRSARFRRARRAGHSSILASRADGLSLPLPLRPSSSSSFSSGKLSFSLSLSLSLPLSRGVLEREEDLEGEEVSARFLWFLASIGTNNPRSTTLDNFELRCSKVLLSLPPRPITKPAQMLNP